MSHTYILVFLIREKRKVRCCNDLAEDALRPLFSRFLFVFD